MQWSNLQSCEVKMQELQLKHDTFVEENLQRNDHNLQQIKYRLQKRNKKKRKIEKYIVVFMYVYRIHASPSEGK